MSEYSTEMASLVRLWIMAHKQMENHIQTTELSRILKTPKELQWNSNLYFLSRKMTISNILGHFLFPSQSQNQPNFELL